MPARAYAMIYNEWFRDENLEAPLMVGYKKKKKKKRMKARTRQIPIR